MSPRRFLAALLLLGAATPALRGFNLSECDGSNTPGNAGILLGWTQPTATSMGGIRLDDGGAPASGLTTAEVDAAWQASFADWSTTTLTTLAFPTPTPTPVTDGQLETALAGGALGSQVCTVITSATSLAGPPVRTGWAAITISDPTGTLGITLTAFLPATRRILFSNILLNDDRAAGASGFLIGGSGTGGHDFQSVATHEIGHFIGGDHSALLPSLMFPFLAAGLAKPLDSDDRDIARFLYPTGATGLLPEANDLTFLDCFNVASSGEVRAPAHAGGCDLSLRAPPGTLPFAGALLLLVLTMGGRLARRPVRGSGGALPCAPPPWPCYSSPP